MNSPHHPHHHHHHDVHQQRLLWFFSFCNQRSSSSSNSSSSSTHSHGGSTRRTLGSRRAKTSNRNKFALQYQQQLQKQQRQSSNVFGMDLIEHTRTFGDHKNSIPFIVQACTKFIEQHGIIFGIYRLSGMRVNIHKLRQDFDKNPKISMIDSESITNDAHAVACVLKQYFRELPTPLLTFHMYEKFIDLFKRNSSILGKDEEDEQIITTTTASTKLTKSIDKEHDRHQIDLDCGTQDEKLLHNSNNLLANTDKLDEQFQNIDDDDEEINCGDTARTISDKQTIQPITKQPPSYSTATPSCALSPINFSKSIDIATTSTMISGNTTSVATTTPKTSRRPTEISSKKPPTHQQSTSAIETSAGARQLISTQLNNPCRINRKSQRFTTSVSDSQLISLSSVVTTTTNDVRYQVKLDDLRDLLLQLPRAHYQTLKYLMRHLAFIAANGEKTGMDSKNVAIVWAPNLLKPRELELSAGHIETLQVIGLQAVITEQLIKHHQFLFSDSLEETVAEEHDVGQVSSSDGKADDCEINIAETPEAKETETTANCS